LRSVDREYRREALRFMGKIVRECPEYFQQSLDYLVMGYHYYRFTRDTVVPEYERVLANIPEDQLPRRTEPSRLRTFPSAASSDVVQITVG